MLRDIKEESLFYLAISPIICCFLQLNTYYLKIIYSVGNYPIRDSSQDSHPACKKCKFKPNPIGREKNQLNLTIKKSVIWSVIEWNTYIWLIIPCLTSDLRWYLQSGHEWTELWGYSIECSLERETETWMQRISKRERESYTL